MERLWGLFHNPLRQFIHPGGASEILQAQDLLQLSPLAQHIRLLQASGQRHSRVRAPTLQARQAGPERADPEESRRALLPADSDTGEVVCQVAARHDSLLLQGQSARRVTDSEFIRAH